MLESKIRIVIANDKEPVRNMLKKFIDSFFNDCVEIAGLAESGEEFLKVVERTVPDAVFVNIQMPDLDGLTAVRILQQKLPELFVVFVSEHTNYAVEAFKLNATDFLIKPFSVDRLGETLARIAHNRSLLETNKIYNFSKKEEASCLIGRLMLKCGHGITIIDKNTILFVEKKWQKCLFHTTSNIYESTCSLSSLEKILVEPYFFRCHKSFIINIQHIEKIMPYADRAYEVIFHNYPHKATMRWEKFKEMCKQVKQDVLSLL